MNQFEAIAKPKYRYMIIKYDAEMEQEIKEKMRDKSVDIFDTSDLDTTIASAYTFLRKNNN